MEIRDKNETEAGGVGTKTPGVANLDPYNGDKFEGALVPPMTSTASNRNKAPSDGNLSLDSGMPAFKDSILESVI